MSGCQTFTILLYCETIIFTGGTLLYVSQMQVMISLSLLYEKS